MEKLEVKGNPKMLMTLGAVLLIIGIVGLFTMAAFSRLIITLLGALLIVGGIIFMIYGFSLREKEGQIIPIALGGVYLGFGIIMVLWPLFVTTGIALFIGIYLAIAGILKMISAYRGEDRKMSILIGIVDLLLALFVFLNWPWDSDMVIGLFISVELILAGIWLLVLARAMKSSEEGTSAQ